MTSKELHEQKIVPLRMELNRLEKKYEELVRKECGEKIGKIANCDNCAFSCIIDVGDYHNICMCNKCICCTDWCFSWTSENDVSKFLRKNYHYDTSIFDRLENIFGDDFLKKCDNSKDAEIVMKTLKLMAEFDGIL